MISFALKKTSADFLCCINPKCQNITTRYNFFLIHCHFKLYCICYTNEHHLCTSYYKSKKQIKANKCCNLNRPNYFITGTGDLFVSCVPFNYDIDPRCHCVQTLFQSEYANDLILLWEGYIINFSSLFLVDNIIQVHHKFTPDIYSGY